MPDFRSAAVVLAAGASTRLGQPKQLVAFEGESLLRRTARLAFEADCSPVCVVLGFESERMRPELAGFPAQIVVNPGWQDGMGSSLRCGMETLRVADPEPDAVLLLVCDQPRLTASHLRELLANHQAGHKAGEITITASVYARRAGVPAVFSSKVFPELLVSVGDRGARDVIQAHAAEVRSISWPAGAFDLDRPEDLTTIERQF
jgi:molybdenum cofactor cytidylyltransferase